MKVHIIALAASGLLVATACSFSEPTQPSAPGAVALPPPEAAAEPAAESSGAAAAESAAAGSSGVVIETIEPDPTTPAEPTAITIPEGTGWTHPEIPLTRQQEDIEACYRFASAQVARESLIDEDRYNSRGNRDVYNLWGEPTLTQRVDYYSERRRRGALFDTCMQSKGYIKN